MSDVILPCPGCGLRDAMRIGQTAQQGRLRWHRSICCPACGNIEEDNEGFPPETIRARLLEINGACALQIEPQFKAGAARLLRNVRSDARRNDG